MTPTNTPIIAIYDIRGWLVDRIAEATGIPADGIDTAAPFATYGLDSIHAVGLSGDLELWLDLELSPTLIWDYPTIEALAEHLREEVERHRGADASATGG